MDRSPAEAGPEPAVGRGRSVNPEHRLAGRDLGNVRQVGWAGRRPVRRTGQPSAASVLAETVLDHAACNIGHQSAIAAAAASHRIGTGSCHGSPAGLHWRSAAQGEGRPDQSGDRADSAPSSPPRSPATASELGRAGGEEPDGWLGHDPRPPAFAAVAQRCSSAMCLRARWPSRRLSGWRRRPCRRRAGPAVAGRTAARGDGGLAGWGSARRGCPRSRGAGTPSR